MERETVGRYDSKTEAATVAEHLGRYCVNKHVVITGAALGGMGFETARLLALCGAEVTICCRTEESAEKALLAIQEHQHDAQIRALVLDLSSFRSVHRAADLLRQRNKGIHVLIHNAALVAGTPCITVDGFEAQWQINFLAPMLLTQLLLPLLRDAGTTDSPARVLCVSCLCNITYTSNEGVHFDPDHKTPHSASEITGMCERYGESKLAMILFARELSRRERLSQSPVIALSLEPGHVPHSRLFRHVTLPRLLMHARKFLMKKAFNISIKECTKSITQGAATILYCSLQPNLTRGGHYADCGENQLVHPIAESETAWEHLWELADQQITQRFAVLGDVFAAVHAATNAT